MTGRMTGERSGFCSEPALGLLREPTQRRILDTELHGRGEAEAIFVVLVLLIAT